MSPSLLTRILALGVGAAIAVLVLLAVPVTFIVAQDAREDVDRSAELTARSVADASARGVRHYPQVCAHPGKVGVKGPA